MRMALPGFYMKYRSDLPELTPLLYTYYSSSSKKVQLCSTTFFFFTCLPILLTCLKNFLHFSYYCKKVHKSSTWKWGNYIHILFIIFIFSNSHHENKFSLVFWKSMKKIREMKSDTMKIHDQWNWSSILAPILMKKFVKWNRVP